MPAIQIKFEPNLFDLFQHCELKCSAACYGWDAFDFSEHWLGRWCEFRDPDVTADVRSEIATLRTELSCRAPDDTVALERFFKPSAQSLLAHLDLIDDIVALRSN